MSPNIQVNINKVYNFYSQDLVLDFTAKAEEFIGHFGSGRLEILGKDKFLSIELETKKHSKDLIVIDNTQNYNSTVALVFGKDFLVSFE